MPETNRVPDWRIWRNVPEVRLWEAVALSLNIDPRQVELNPHAWMSGHRSFLEAQDFKDRVFVAERNLGSTLLEPINWRGADSKVRLSSFVKWAASVGWELPNELHALVLQPQAKTPSEENSRTKTPRRDEKRPDIKRAIEALAGSEEWKNSSDKRRCRLVDDYLKMHNTWCLPRTLRRALQDLGLK